MGNISWSERGRIDMGMTKVGMTRGAWCGSPVLKELSLLTCHHSAAPEPPKKSTQEL